MNFTNPIEIVKTRMQLQGELAGKNVKIYRNPIQGIWNIYVHEGLRGVQKGLVGAYVHQTILNGTRLGFYDPLRSRLNSLVFPNEDPRKFQNGPINVFSGAATGALAAFLSSPCYLVKTRMQSYTGTALNLTGQQTKYSSFFTGIHTLYQTEGVKGLFRGCGLSMLRTGVASAIQLPVYNVTKRVLTQHSSLQGTGLHLTSSAVTGMAVGFAVNPFDVVMTRLYNQKGNLYKGFADCVVKIYTVEGVLGFFKGLVPSMSRMAPHTILTLTFMETTMRWVNTADETLTRFTPV